MTTILQMIEGNQMLSKICLDLANQGFDISLLFSTNWMKDVHSPTENKLPANGFGLLIGNTRKLWPIFLQSLNKANVGSIAEPIDDYSTAKIQTIFEQNIEQPCTIIWQQDASVSMQHIASATGVYDFDQEQMLCIHPQYGPWTAFRAVVIFPQEIVQKHFSDISQLIYMPRPKSSRSLCKELGCFKKSKEALDKALNAANCNRSNSSNVQVETIQKSDSWKVWAEIRLVCQVGTEFEYYEDQLEYHYTANKHILMRNLNKIEIKV